ncbi:iron-containing alcohol dehydrogenase family protein [Neobacillus notoginsengisoli]|uniref:Iron-containing alcohol dehydrogenase family protein n=1 Tax=Neobacillus notoginsengisoli TaxID=1578198 RepID=A0A417Z0H2_9BACI|nr:iron-containing alcohol dehydrogenase family protein [Neobacillus notoginsengisoli]RHW43448.1 iron-containing alcohol dehydrogenase family protein [Neobacillus notoginsengisoli]
MKTITVHGAPSEYILLEGILDQLEAKCLERGFQKVLIVHGVKSWQAAAPFWPVFTKVKVEEYQYHGENSFSEINAISTVVNNGHFDAVIGVGGGKVLDLAKSVSHTTHTQAVLIPTLPSNCSPWTPVSVVYDDTGTFARFDIYPISASLVLVEPRILLLAPLNMLIAGIADTLAKWYEADVQLAEIKNKSIPLEICTYTAKRCKDVLLEHSEGALQAAKSSVLNDDFIKVTEAIIMLGGMVGGFGDHYGRVAGAHSIHNGLTALKETHQALHGEKVAYGILVQLVLENKWEEIKDLIPFYRKLGLPMSLSELGVQHINEETISSVAKKSVARGESIHVIPGEMTADAVSKAITELETYIQSRYSYN